METRWLELRGGAARLTNEKVERALVICKTSPLCRPVHRSCRAVGTVKRRLGQTKRLYFDYTVLHIRLNL